jgi:hypothetical protein
MLSPYTGPARILLSTYEEKGYRNEQGKNGGAEKEDDLRNNMGLIDLLFEKRCAQTENDEVEREVQDTDCGEKEGSARFLVEA